MTLRSALLLLVPLGVIASACSGGPTSGPTEPVPPPPPPPQVQPARGLLWIQVATNTGQSEKFEISEPTVGTRLVKANDFLRLDLLPGTYTFLVTLPEGSHSFQRCSLRDGDRRTVTLSAGTTTTLVFVVQCPGGTVT